MKNLVIRLHSMLISEKGRGMVEYGLIIGLVAIVLITALTAIGGQGGIGGIFTKITGALTTANGTP